ncbi:MAG: hypothetical protein FD168_1194 [Desulfobulbaceae bacterium]|nr:MAG: hypothetical protein FD168_1194 [Desulfobulbaceae bacterium]
MGFDSLLLSVLKAAAQAAWAFFNCYFLRAGILDGAPGLIQAQTHAVNTLFKYLKPWELQQQGSLSGKHPNSIDL